jgi:hypothetical protein
LAPLGAAQDSTVTAWIESASTIGMQITLLAFSAED